MEMKRVFAIERGIEKENRVLAVALEHLEWSGQQVTVSVQTARIGDIAAFLSGISFSFFLGANLIEIKQRQPAPDALESIFQIVRNRFEGGSEVAHRL